MLPGVLLHVIVAARPVDAALDLFCGADRRFQEMRDAVFFVDHFSHSNAAQHAQVERLPAGSWIEGSAV